MKNGMAFVLILLVSGGSAFGQARTDTNATSGPKWESGRDRSKSRDPNTRNVEGVVRLPNDNSVEGAVVKLKNLKTNQVRSFFTLADGKYHFYGLSTNIDYELVGEYKGLTSPVRSLTVFDNRLDAVVNLKLEKNKKPEAGSETAASKPETSKQ